MIVITGCGRSGTSLAAKLVADALGVKQPLDAPPIDRAAPTGYYESTAVTAYHEGLLARLGYGYLRPPTGPLGRGGLLMAARTFEGAEAISRAQDAALELGYLKDPRLVFMGAAMEPRGSRLLIVERDRAELVVAWRRTYGFRLRKGVEIVDRYLLGIEGLKRVWPGHVTTNLASLRGKQREEEAGRVLQELALGDRVPGAWLDGVR